MTDTSAEREFETGKDESWAERMAGQTRSFEWHIHRMFADAQAHANRIYALAEQQLQNAIVINNQVAINASSVANKDALAGTRHQDIAADAEWNPVQQGASDALTARAVTIDDVSLKAIGAAVAAAIAEALAAKSA